MKLFYLKYCVMELILVFVLFTFPHPSFTQGQIEKVNRGKWQYEGNYISHYEIKRLIISSGDSASFHYYKMFEGGFIVGAGLGIVGSVTCLVGTFRVLEEFWLGITLDPDADNNRFNQGGKMMAVGGILMISGIITWSISLKSLDKAVIGYNSLQKQASLDFGINKSGIGLTYNF